jgi:hypothetical protein
MASQDILPAVADLECLLGWQEGCTKDPIAADPFFFPLPLSVLSILISNALFSLKIWQVTAGK